MHLITGTRDMDDQHLLLVQAIGLVEEAIDRPATSEDELEAAWWGFYDTMESHMLAEAKLFVHLPPEQAAAHATIHARAMALTKEYSFRNADPEWAKLRRILTMVRSHMHSLEESTLIDAIKKALRAPLSPEHT